jgi:hypothetical protein
MNEPSHEEGRLDALSARELEIESLNLDAEIALQRSVLVLFLTALYYATAILVQLHLGVRISVGVIGIIGAGLEMVQSFLCQKASNTKKSGG